MIKCRERVVCEAAGRGKGEASDAAAEGEEASQRGWFFCARRQRLCDGGVSFCGSRQSAAARGESRRACRGNSKRRMMWVKVSWGARSGSDGAEQGEGPATQGTSWRRGRRGGF